MIQSSTLFSILLLKIHILKKKLSKHFFWLIELKDGKNLKEGEYLGR